MGAYHEAAHVIVAWARGIEVSRVHLKAGEAAKVRSDLDGMTIRKSGTWIENARVSIAGRLADFRAEEALGIKLHFDTSGGEEHNDDESFKLNLYYAGQRDMERASELVEPTMKEAEVILESRNDQWQELAEELFQCGDMDQADIARILGTLPEVDDETRMARESVLEEVRSNFPL